MLQLVSKATVTSVVSTYTTCCSSHLSEVAMHEAALIKLESHSQASHLDFIMEKSSKIPYACRLKQWTCTNNGHVHVHVQDIVHQ